MPRFSFIALVLCARLLWTLPLAAAETDSAAGRIAHAASEFLGTLDQPQREKVQFDFGNDAQRKKWSNLPSGIFERNGLRMGDLTAPQRNAVWKLLAAALSPQGLEKVREIVQADEVLKKSSRGSRPMFGQDEYYISLLGKPSPTAPWTIQFGGHHLGLNITIAGDHGTLAPSHTGAQPAIYQVEGRTVRPLGAERDKALALVRSLTPEQRKNAVIGAQMRDLVLGPGRDGGTIQPEGVKGAELSESQRAMLLDLAGEWVSIQESNAAAAKLAEIKNGLSETYFAWSGPIGKDAPAYFRIQGPSVIIEYAPQRLGGDPAKHIHTIYRDPANEYGRKWWEK